MQWKSRTKLCQVGVSNPSNFDGDNEQITESLVSLATVVLERDVW